MNADDQPTEELHAAFFDGRSARARPVRLRLDRHLLHLEGDGVSMQVPIDRVRWPERTRHGARVAHFEDGGSVQADDATAWDNWCRNAGLAESKIVAAQQNWRSTGIAVLVLVLLGIAGFFYGVPVLSQVLLAAIPPSVDRAIGNFALRSLNDKLLHPSTLDAARQAQLRSAFAQGVAHAGPALAGTRYELRFFASPAHGANSLARHGLGPNAFALPGGTIVVTDEIVALLKGRDDVLIGVLGHELGHVRRRHGMRLLVQTALLSTAAGVVWGDFSSVLATAPALLGQSAYSRDFERDADTDAIALLRANRLSPAVMVELFQRLATERSTAQPADKPGRRAQPVDLGIALASHPADSERMRRFNEAAAH